MEIFVGFIAGIAFQCGLIAISGGVVGTAIGSVIVIDALTAK